MTTDNHTPDYDAIKAKQQATWSAGDYGRVGVTLQITGEQLCEAMDLRAGASVLDVASGNGNAALAAGRRFCKVLATDYVPDLLAQSAERAAADGLEIAYREADAEALPFAEGEFDNVISTFGVMFAPDQARAAAELVRVCRPGGKIGLANWTPDSFIGQLFATIGRHVAPPPGVKSPAAWGTQAFVDEHFAPHVQGVQLNERQFVFRYVSADHWIEVFSEWYGPTLKAFEAVGEAGRDALRQDIVDLLERCNTADDGTLVVPSTYAEIVVTR